MSTSQNTEVIEAGVYDTSRGVSDSNWQWGNVRFDESWEAVAALIHQGWPAEKRIFTDQQAILLGVIRHSDFVWLYRIYPAGRDEHGRGGRYFFALVRILSLDAITHPQVAGLLAYFEKERGLPLNTKPLEGGWPDAEPNSTMAQLRKDLEENSRFGHWGMDGAGRMIRLLDPEPAKKEITQDAPFTGRGKLIIGAVALVASTVGGYLLQQSATRDKSVDDILPSPIPSSPPKTKNSGPNFVTELPESNRAAHLPHNNMDSQIESIPDKRIHLNPDPLKKEEDSKVPPNATPKQSIKQSSIPTNP